MSLFACVWFGYHLRLGEDPESYELYRNARRLMGSSEAVRNLGDQEAALRDFAHKNGLVVQYLWGQGFTLSIAGTGRITYDQPIALGDLPRPDPEAINDLTNLMSQLRGGGAEFLPQWHLAVGSIK